MPYLLMLLFLVGSHGYAFYKGYSIRGKMCATDMALMEEAFRLSIENKRNVGEREGQAIDIENDKIEAQIRIKVDEMLSKIRAMPDNAYICTKPNILRDLENIK
jgi:hypothetical protein